MEKITAEDIIKLREALGDKPNISELKVIENEFLPDNMICVSSNVFKALKEKSGIVVSEGHISVE